MAIHSGILDDGSQFQIMPHTRKVVVPETHKTIGTVGEHNSEQLTFKCPKVIDGHDVLNCASHYVSWMNANGGQGYDPVTDITSDEDNMYFKWVIPLGFTLTAGKVKFAVHFEDFDDDGELIYSWGSAVCEDCEILKGLNYKQTRVPIPEGYLKPEGILEITENGEFDISKYATVVVRMSNVAFVLDGVQYAVINGITWGEWVRDDSNPYFVDVDEGITKDGETFVYNSDGVMVRAGDDILVGTYTSKTEGGQVIFYVDDVRYTVEAGTTWRQWTAEQSTYKIYNDYVMLEDMYVYDAEYNKVLVRDEITTGRYRSVSFEYNYEVNLYWDDPAKPENKFATLKLTDAPEPTAKLTCDSNSLIITLQCGNKSTYYYLSELEGKNVTNLRAASSDISAGVIYNTGVEYDISSTSPTTKTVSIEGVTYQFEDGMTWDQWIRSTYNTKPYYILDGFVSPSYNYTSSGTLTYVCDQNHSAVKLTDKISETTTYISWFIQNAGNPSESQVQFTIEGTSYSVNVGSTWYDFYQKHMSMFTIDSGGYMRDTDEWKYLVFQSTSGKCHNSDIISNTAYIFKEL